MAHKQHLFIPMSDGVRLAATLYVPDDDGPWPAILEALPYRKDDLTASYRPEYHRLADEGGYILCRVDVRGTGTSEGVATDEYPRREQADLVEVIDWLATQEWSTGSVGMYGTSYSGFNSIQVAMERPPALKAIIPIFATDDRYADDVHYFGGALKALDLVDYPAYMVAMNALPPVPSLAGETWREQWAERVKSAEPWVLKWLEHQRFGPFWQHGSLRPDYGAIEAPTMIVAGFADGYTNNSLRTMAELRCPKRLILGPWAHSSIESSNPGPNIDIVSEHLRWFDRWVKGIENGVDREPEIVLFVRRSTRPAPDLAEVRGEWRFERGWPLDRGVELPFELEKAIAPGRDGASVDELEVRGDVGWTAWISCAGAMPWGQPADQRPDEARSLVYEWEPLEEEVEILGHPRLHVTVTSSQPIAYLSAKLCDVFPDGTSALVTRGLLNLAHRDSREEPSPMEPGRPYSVTLELEVTSWVFERDHRIRLDLAGSDWPNAWPPPRPTTLRVDRVGSTLVLPIVDGEPDVEGRPVMPPPREKGERATPNVDPAGLTGLPSSGPDDPSPGGDKKGGYTWRMEQDVAARETRAVVGSWGWTEAEDLRPRFWEQYEGTVAVSTRDPGVARAEGRIVYRMEWPEATVSSELRHRITSDADSYAVWLELELSEDGATKWTRRWERTIPRDHQ